MPPTPNCLSKCPRWLFWLELSINLHNLQFCGKRVSVESKTIGDYLVINVGGPRGLWAGTFPRQTLLNIKKLSKHVYFLASKPPHTHISSVVKSVPWYEVMLQVSREAFKFSLSDELSREIISKINPFDSNSVFLFCFVFCLVFWRVGGLTVFVQ